MFRYHMFHNNKLIGQEEILPGVALDILPIGTYIFASERNRWYLITSDENRAHRDNEIRGDQIPKELRMLCLLHGITPSLKPY
jgi:hypothetical protein